MLEPTLGSRILAWQTVDGPVAFPSADSRKLFPRTDSQQRQYLHLVDPDSATGLGKGQPYSVEVMNETVQRAVANAGALGMYCNLLMVAKAAYGDLPKQPPAPLEDFIDASVKTGSDLSAGAAWCFEASRKIADSGQPVPALVQSRLALGKDAPPVANTSDHWMDRLVSAVTLHIEQVRAKRDELVKASVPPARLFDHAFNETDPRLLDVGVTLNRIYKNTLNQAIRKHNHLTPQDYEAARIATEDYLALYPDEQHGAIIRGALVSTYMSDNPSDAALWMRGAKTTEGHAPGMANKTLRALREIGVLDELGEVSGHVVRYPGAVVSAPDFQRSIGISGVWFNWYRAWQAANGQTPAAAMSNVPRAQANWAKQQVAQMSQEAYQGLSLRVQREGDRLKTYTQDGRLFGFISRDSEKLAAEGDIRLGFAIYKDGNVRAVWQSTRLADNHET